MKTILVPIIRTTARSTGQLIVRAGRKPKLSAEQRLLAAILFLKKVHFIGFVMIDVYKKTNSLITRIKRQETSHLAGTFRDLLFATIGFLFVRLSASI